MSTRRLKIGITALFDPADTPHARTFLRALAIATDQVPGVASLHLTFLDDGANPSRAVQVAEHFIAAGVDAVVGHFSSDAARAAADLYAQAQVPLLTPAATLSALTHGRTNVFRLCPPDVLLARRLVAFLGTQGLRCCTIEHDPSAHGRALAEEIGRAALAAGLTIVADPAVADAGVFAGRLAASRQHVLTRRQQGLRGPIVLTDDAASPHLLAGVTTPGPVYVIGFVPARWIEGAHSLLRAYEAQFGGEPDVYFLESVAALSVVSTLRPHSAPGYIEQLNRGSFATPLGQLRFRNGELEQISHAVWHAGTAGLAPLHLLNEPTL